jgi:uncharacterized protein YjiS (DUF1127 family)
MTCNEMTSTADRAAPALSGGLREGMGRLWRTLVERRAQRATVRILQSLDARTLKDIGISHGEINSIVYGGRHDRVRRQD